MMLNCRCWKRTSIVVVPSFNIIIFFIPEFICDSMLNLKNLAAARYVVG